MDKTSHELSQKVQVITRNKTGIGSRTRTTVMTSHNDASNHAGRKCNDRSDTHTKTSMILTFTFIVEVPVPHKGRGQGDSPRDRRVICAFVVAAVVVIVLALLVLHFIETYL